MRRPRFTIGGLMVLVAMVGLSLAGERARRHYARCIRRAEICAGVESRYRKEAATYEGVARRALALAREWPAQADKSHDRAIGWRKRARFNHEADFLRFEENERRWAQSKDRLAASADKMVTRCREEANKAAILKGVYQNAVFNFWRRSPQQMP